MYCDNFCYKKCINGHFLLQFPWSKTLLSIFFCVLKYQKCLLDVLWWNLLCNLMTICKWADFSRERITLCKNGSLLILFFLLIRLWLHLLYICWSCRHQASASCDESQRSLHGNMPTFVSLWFSFILAENQSLCARDMNQSDSNSSLTQLVFETFLPCLDFSGMSHVLWGDCGSAKCWQLLTWWLC